MTTSGTYNFYTSEQLVQYITEAFERLGFRGEQVSGDMMTSAINSLNFMFCDWASDGSKQWGIRLVTQTLVPNQVTFTMPVGTYDILNMVNVLNNVAIGMSQISREEYLYINVKTVTTSNPVNYFVDKSVAPPVVYMYPVPNTNQVSIQYNALTMSQDVNDVSLQSGITPWWQNAIPTCLCALLAEKFKPEMYLEKNTQAQLAYQRASRADSDKTEIFFRTPYRFG